MDVALVEDSAQGLVGELFARGLSPSVEHFDQLGVLLADLGRPVQGGVDEVVRRCSEVAPVGKTDDRAAAK